MLHSVGLAHINRQDDGTFTGEWEGFTLRSAFQPIFSFHDGKLSIAAFEGLIRPFWETQAVSPKVFFNNVPPAEKLHVETLTRTLHLVNAAACLDPAASIFINFDPSVFVDRVVAGMALHDTRVVLRNAGIDPGRVVCEVTEQNTGSQETLYHFVEALKVHGFRIAVDDFGSAASDINRVRDLKPDIVKFDAQWITRLMESGPGFALLSAMVSTFADQGILTVFEGIEETWQLELAEKSGASMVQGFVLARPEIVPGSHAYLRKSDVGASHPGEAGHGDSVSHHREAHGKTFGRRVNRP